MIALGPDPRFITAIRNLRRCILRLNELDEQYDNFIETVEREDLCAEFDEIVYAVGLHDYEDLAGRWRDW